MKNNKGKGNRHGQNLRRKERMYSRPQRQDEAYRLIDGNMSHYPVAACVRYRGFLSEGLMETHRCRERACINLRDLPDT